MTVLYMCNNLRVAFTSHRLPPSLKLSIDTQATVFETVPNSIYTLLVSWFDRKCYTYLTVSFIIDDKTCFCFENQFPFWVQCVIISLFFSAKEAFVFVILLDRFPFMSFWLAIVLVKSVIYHFDPNHYCFSPEKLVLGNSTVCSVVTVHITQVFKS